MKTKFLAGAATITATSVLALMLAIGPVNAQDVEIEQEDNSIGGDQTAVLQNDTDVTNRSANAGNDASVQADRDSHNNDSDATNRSANAGNDANVQADRDSNNTEFDVTNRSANAGSDANVQADRDSNNSATADNGSVAAGQDLDIDDSFNDESVNATDSSIAAGDDVEIEDSAVALGGSTAIMSVTELDATITANQVHLDDGEVTTGNVLGGSSNFQQFTGVNSQNINSGVLSIGQNASTIAVHGQVTIGN
jgi:hypothetical protein